MTSGTVVLIENWPTIRGADPKQTLLRSNRIVSDVFVSSNSTNQSFRDIIADGLIITCLRQSGMFIELIVVNIETPDHSCHAFSDSVDSYVTLDSIDALFAHIENVPLSTSSIRLVVLRIITTINQNATVKQGAANSAMTQMITSRDAMATVDRLYTLCIKDGDEFAMFAYQTVLLQDNVWCPTHATCAILPIGITIPSPSNIAHSMTLFIQRFNIDTDDSDFIRTPMYSTTIDETEATWACTVRLANGNERYELCCTFNPYDFEALTAMAADIGTPIQTWEIQSQSFNGNLTNDNDWLNSPSAKDLCVICEPIIRDTVRRRSTTNVQSLVESVHETYLREDEIPNEPPDELADEIPDELPYEIPEHQTEDEYILSMLTNKFGEDGTKLFSTIKKLMGRDMPYTIILCNAKVHTFEGALTPTLIQHLASMGATIPVDSDNRKTMQLSSRSSSLFLQNMKVDFNSMLYIRGIVCYTSQKMDRFRRLGHIRRGSVKLFAARKEQNRKHR